MCHCRAIRMHGNIFTHFVILIRSDQIHTSNKRNMCDRYINIKGISLLLCMELDIKYCNALLCFPLFKSSMIDKQLLQSVHSFQSIQFITYQSMLAFFPMNCTLSGHVLIDFPLWAKSKHNTLLFAEVKNKLLVEVKQSLML